MLAISVNFESDPIVFFFLLFQTELLFIEAMPFALLLQKVFIL